MATHSSILAWRIPWTEKTGRLQLMGLQESDTTEVFWGTSNLFSTVAAPIFIPTNSVGGFPFLYTFSSRILHQKKLEYTFFSSAQGTFSRIDHILGHKTNLNKFKSTEIISSIFPDHNSMNLGINHRKRNEGKKITWRLNKMLKSQWVNQKDI